MELSNTEIKIVVKNMAREMVKKATAKNTTRTSFLVEVTWSTGDKTRTEVNGVERNVYEAYPIGREFKINVGPREVWAKVKAVKILKSEAYSYNATAKNATQFKYGDKVTVDGKYEGVGQAVKDRTGDVYFKKA